MGTEWALGVTYCLRPQANHWAKEECAVAGNVNLQGCVCGLHPGGVAAAGHHSEEPLQGCHAGELQPPGLHG